MARIIGIISGKGGVGKTTVATNLAAIMAEDYNQDVFLVDCNFTTSHVSFYLGMYYCPVTLNDVLKGKAKISQAVYPHQSGMKVVPAGVASRTLKGVDYMFLKRHVKKLAKNADIILLDSAPGLSREAFATMKASDELLFVTLPNIPSTMDVIRCHEYSKKVKKKPLGVVVNMRHKRPYELSKEEIEQLAELPVIAEIPYDQYVHKSLAEKIPVSLLNPYSPASNEFKKLAAHLLGAKYTPTGSIERFNYWIKNVFGPRKKKKS